MRITWGVAILALALAAGANRTVLTQGNMTPEQLEASMKGIASAQAAMGKKMQGNQLADAAKDAEQLVAHFGEVEKFFAQHKKTDAVTWAQQGKTSATALASALAAGDATKATTERGNMAATCKQCHAAYREGAPGNYTIKAGAL